jgi:hypothetical protein
MPEFILNHGSPEAARQFNDLDAFTQGYIEAMFFTDASDPDDGELAHATFAELAPKTLAKIVNDCSRFQNENRADLDEGLDNGRINGYDEQSAGRDFWYTRNGHGVGFWDRKLGDIGDVLSNIARKWGSVDLYRGDDELIYL